MKWYYQLWDTTRKNRFVSNDDNLKNYDYWDFLEGKHINKWDNLAWIKNNKPHCEGFPEDVLQNHLGLPVFSERMRNVLNENDVTGIQYLPIQVFRINGDPILGYEIANILNVAPALDLEKSGYYVIPNDHINVKQRGKVGAIHKFVLYQSMLGDFDIFRLQEHTSDVILSERLVKIFKKNKLTGWVFKEVGLS